MNIAYIGNFTPEKGSCIFVDVVLANRSEHKWYIFGRIGDFGSLAKISQYVSNISPYESGQLGSLLIKHQIDLVLILSILPETFSKTFFEVLKTGTPILAFDVGYPSYRFPKYTGFMHSSNKSDSTVKMIAHLNSKKINHLKCQVEQMRKNFFTGSDLAANKKIIIIKLLLS